jgi:hypothetical protein
VLLRTFRGEDLIKTLPVEIPANAPDNLSLIISDGQRLQQAEVRELRLPQRRSVDQIVRAMNHTRRNNTIYVKLMSGDAGAILNGEALSSLPPSVLAVMEADRSGGTFNALSSATLGEWSIPTDHAVSGVRTLTLSLAN